MFHLEHFDYYMFSIGPAAAYWYSTLNIFFKAQSRTVFIFLFLTYLWFISGIRSSSAIRRVISLFLIVCFFTSLFLQYVFFLLFLSDISSCCFWYSSNIWSVQISNFTSITTSYILCALIFSISFVCIKCREEETIWIVYHSLNSILFIIIFCTTDQSPVISKISVTSELKKNKIARMSHVRHSGYFIQACRFVLCSPQLSAAIWRERIRFRIVPVISIFVIIPVKHMF